MSRWAPSEEEFKARVAAFNRGEEAERKGNGSVFSIKTARSGAATTAVEAISIVVARDKAPPEPSIDQVPALAELVFRCLRVKHDTSNYRSAGITEPHIVVVFGPMVRATAYASPD